MKVVLKLIIVICVFVMTSCSKESNDLVVGGLYTSQNEDGSFRVSKILALDDFAVHIRMYSNEFEKKPTNVNSSDLTFLIGHAPVDKNGFLLGNPELLKIEKVSEAELEGYRYYLDAMNK